MRNGKHMRPLALLLSAVLLVTQLPAVAMAENRVPEDGSIASFAAFPDDVEKQTVTVGTELSALELPDTVKAAVYHVTANTAIPDEGNPEEENSGISTATPSEAGDGVSGNDAGSSSGKDSGNTVTTVTTSEEEIPVTWGSEPAYDGDRLGDYVFTADVGGYTLSDGAKLPQITVTVIADTVENSTETPPTEALPCTMTEGCTIPAGHEGECVTEKSPVNGVPAKTIANWTFIDDDNYLTEGELALPGVNAGRQADFGTVVSMLPKQISAEVEGETDPVLVDITDWSCPEFAKGSDGNWPLTGEYTFTAKLQEGYVCEPLPTVKVLVGGADLYAAETGDFTVTGNSADYEFKDPVLTIKSGATVTIKNTTPNAPTTHRIKVAENATNVTITLAGVNIEDDKNNFCAFEIATGATVTLNLEAGSDNILKSSFYRAGLEVPDGAKVIIDGDGSLDASSSGYGAGIGSGMATADNLKSGEIEIRSGTITATSGDIIDGEGGAGIGGGSGVSYNSFDAVSNGKVTINGGVVTATGGGNAAGIGGGGSADQASGGGGGIVTIGRGTVTAIGGGSGAGIGGGGCNEFEGNWGEVVVLS